MAEELKVLYHGTTVNIAELGEDIFGEIILDQPNMSGNLTDSRKYATEYALSKQLLTRHFACLITYHVPEQLVVDHGVIAYDGQAHGFSVKNPVMAHELPEKYISRLWSTADLAQHLIDAGQISFFRVDSRYRVAVEVVGQEIFSPI